MFNSGLNPKDVLTIHALLAKQPKVESAILFGSRAMGSYRAGSDVDLTLVGTDLVLDDAMQLHSDLDDSDLPYKFDVSVKALIQNKELLDHIERVGKVIYQTDRSENTSVEVRRILKEKYASLRTRESRVLAVH